MRAVTKTLEVPGNNCGWMRGRWTRGGLGVGALAVVLAADTMLRRPVRLRLLAALLDEPAHVATTFLCLGGTRDRLGNVSLGSAVLWGVLIDADHVPSDVLNWYEPNPAAVRPAPHALWTVALLLTAARRTDRARPWFLGAALGVATHLLRDLATGGAPLWWPLSRRAVTIPPGAYYGLLLAGAIALARAQAPPLPPPAAAAGEGAGLRLLAFGAAPTTARGSAG